MFIFATISGGNKKRESPPALRFTFSYQGSDLKMSAIERLEKVTPPSDSLEPLEDHSGFWYELQDAQGKPVYRRIIHNPISYAVEVPTGQEEGETLQWLEVQHPQGDFTLLVPELASARDLVFFSSPLDIEDDTQAAGEIFRLDLSQAAQKQEDNNGLF